MISLIDFLQTAFFKNKNLFVEKIIWKFSVETKTNTALRYKINVPTYLRIKKKKKKIDKSISIKN